MRRNVWRLTEVEVWINTLSQMSLSGGTLLIWRDFWLIFSVMFASSVCFLSAAFWGDIALDEDDLRMFRRRSVGTNRTDSGRINLPTWGQQAQTWRSEPIVSLCLLVFQLKADRASVVRGGRPPPDPSGCGLTASSHTWSVGISVVSCDRKPNSPPPHTHTEGVTRTDPFQAAREPFSVRRCVTGRDTPAWRLRRGRLRRAT